MEPIAFTIITHVPGCLKCGRPFKGHPLLYGTNCALAIAKEHADESRDILACHVEGLPALLLPGKPPVVDQAPPVPSKQHPKPLARTGQSMTVPLVTTMTTITTRGSTECSLAVLSTRAGQQAEQSAQDRQQIDKLSQLSDTTMQLTHISKVLDCLLENHTPMTMMARARSVPVSSSARGTAPSEQLAALPHQSTALGKVNPSTSSLHINGQAAPLSKAGFSQPSQDLQDQAPFLQDQAHSRALNHSTRLFIPSNFLPQFP